MVGAVEMVPEGCTAVYDLFVEVPGPTRDGIAAMAEAYRTVGMRAVIAPMAADLTLHQAVPALADFCPALAQAPWPISQWLSKSRQPEVG